MKIGGDSSFLDLDSSRPTSSSSSTHSHSSLARAVYYTSREGQEVRDDLYVALAAVLAFVFGLNTRAGGTPPPVIHVPPTARFDENGMKQA